MQLCLVCQELPLWRAQFLCWPHRGPVSPFQHCTYCYFELSGPNWTLGINPFLDLLGNLASGWEGPLDMEWNWNMRTGLKFNFPKFSTKCWTSSGMIFKWVQAFLFFCNFARFNNALPVFISRTQTVKDRMIVKNDIHSELWM